MELPSLTRQISKSFGHLSKSMKADSRSLTLEFSRAFSNLSRDIKSGQSLTIQAAKTAQGQINSAKNLFNAFESQTGALKEHARELRANAKQLNDVQREIKNGIQEQLDIATDPTRTPQEQDLAYKTFNHLTKKLSDTETLIESVSTQRSGLREAIGTSMSADTERERVETLYKERISAVNEIFGVNFKEVDDKRKEFTASLGTTRGKIIQLGVALTTLGAIGIKVFSSWQSSLGSVSQAATMTGRTFASTFKAFTTSGIFVSLSTSGEILEHLSDEMGTLNVPTKAVAEAGRLSAVLGLSAHEAANLVGHLKLLYEGDMKGVKDVDQYARALAVTNDLAPKKVLQDMAQNMGIMARYSKDNVKNFVDATVQARKLGTTISSIDSTMDGLLDFESSLDAEMQASAMLGQTLDLSAARAAALKNDHAGVQEALADQLGGIDIGSKNRLQQDALARAIGMPLDELVRISQFSREGGHEVKAADMAHGKDPLVDKLGTYTDAIGSFTKVLMALLVVNGMRVGLGMFGGGGVKGILGKLGVGAALGAGATKMMGGVGAGDGSGGSGGGALATVASTAVGGAAMFSPTFWKKITSRFKKPSIPDVVDDGSMPRGEPKSLQNIAKGSLTDKIAVDNTTMSNAEVAKPTSTDTKPSGKPSTPTPAAPKTPTPLSTVAVAPRARIGTTAGRLARVGGMAGRGLGGGLVGGMAGTGLGVAMGGSSGAKSAIGSTIGMGLGAALGSIVPGLGTAVGAAVGSGLGGLVGSLMDKPKTAVTPDSNTTEGTQLVRAEMDSSGIERRLDQVIRAIETKQLSVYLDGKKLHQGLYESLPRLNA